MGNLPCLPDITRGRIMRKLVLIWLFFVASGIAARDFMKPAHPGSAELGMSVVGSSVAGATAWGGYLLWNLSYTNLCPDDWHPAFETVGRVGLYGFGYGVLIPLGAYSGVRSVALASGDVRPRAGAIIGAYLGTAACLPFTVMVLDEPTWGRAALTAGSILVLPPLCAWLGYRLTPIPNDDEETSFDTRLYPYIITDGEQVSVGLCLRF
jgi:hypothetical protein